MDLVFATELSVTNGLIFWYLRGIYLEILDNTVVNSIYVVVLSG